MTPAVTVLMSVYNGLPYVGEAIDSILRQTFGDFEFLIVEDGSTDRSGDLLAEYAKQDRRIRVLNNAQNCGMGYSLARGIAAAQAPWVARMDSDDVALPDRLEREMAFVTEHNDVDVVGGWAIDVDENGKVLGERRVPTSNDEIRRLIWTCPFIHPTTMFRREAIRAIGSYPTWTRRSDDYMLWFHCASAGLRFANLAVPLVYYRVTENNFRRNSRRAVMEQVRIGWRGCWIVGASPLAYVGVAAPMLWAVGPPRFRIFVHRLLRTFDPRMRAGRK